MSNWGAVGVERMCEEAGGLGLLSRFLNVFAAKSYSGGEYRDSTWALLRPCLTSEEVKEPKCQ